MTRCELKLSIVCGNLELRNTETKDFPLEISLWVNNTPQPFRLVIAWWKQDSEDYNLEFIGNRPLSDDVIEEDFLALVRTGYAVLENIVIGNDED
jgi:hypothetical protein